MSPEEARARLASLGFGAGDVEVLAAHFLEAERAGRAGHGLRRIEWLETWTELEPDARPRRVVAEPGYERWHGNGALGYLVLHSAVEAQLADPPSAARLVVLGQTFPIGVLGHWTRRLAAGGLVAVLTATSPRRLGHPDGGPKLTGTNPLSIAIPSSRTSRWGASPTATCSSGRSPKTTSHPSAARKRTRRSRSRRACSCSSTR